MSGDLIVAAGGKELFHLAQTEKLRVFVQVPQAMARSVRTGQTAEMTVSEIPGRSLQAQGDPHGGRNSLGFQDPPGGA